VSPAVSAAERKPGSNERPRQLAEQVLDSLIDARLLTSYEVSADDEGAEPHHRIEIVHESLLSNWPRLVRWQTQDAEGAQLRDDLRQAAQRWEAKGRPKALLWTGTAFKEFELWRERYPGGLTTSEEAYAEAMETHAQRRQRRRRLAVAATIAVLLVVVAVITGLWVQSRRSERQAIAAARRAEASKLFALGQLEEAEHPTAALAYAIKSLELADSPDVRRFALEMLWRGPTAFVLGANEEVEQFGAHFSPDGKWLLEIGEAGRTRLWANDGSELPWLEGHEAGTVWGGFSSDSRWLTTADRTTTRFWSLPAVEEVRQVEREGEAPLWAMAYGDYLLEWIPLPDQGDGVKRRLARGWPMSGGEPETLGLFHLPPGTAANWWVDTDPMGQRLLVAADGDLYQLLLRGSEVTSYRSILQSSDPIRWFELEDQTGRLVTEHASGQLALWAGWGDDDRFDLIRTIPGEPDQAASSLDIDPQGEWLVAARDWQQTVELWELAAPPDTRPLTLRRGEVSRLRNAALHPSGRWLATVDPLAYSIWPLSRPYPRVIASSGEEFSTLAFDPQGEWLAAASWGTAGGGVWIWPLSPTAEESGGEVLENPCGFFALDVSPKGDLLAAGSWCGEIFLLRPSGALVKQLADLSGSVISVAFDSQGLRLAAAGGLAPGKTLLSVWNLETEETQALDPGRHSPITSVEFTPDGRLLSSSLGGDLRLWDLADGTSELLLEGDTAIGARLSADGRFAVGIRYANPQVPSGKAFVYDLEERTSWELESHGDEVSRLQWHPAGDLVVTPSRDGSIRVGPMSGEEPHLLLGHERMVWDVAVHPNGQWIASASTDGTVRLWPMPQGQPFHTLPYDELLERLRSLTNYRIVEDEEAPSGYRLDFEPFEGWNREPPTW
jgi:WD40 repeat protein